MKIKKAFVKNSIQFNFKKATNSRVDRFPLQLSPCRWARYLGSDYRVMKCTLKKHGDRVKRTFSVTSRVPISKFLDREHFYVKKNTKEYGLRGNKMLVNCTLRTLTVRNYFQSKNVFFS